MAAPWAEQTLPRYLRPATAPPPDPDAATPFGGASRQRRAWQPADFLPDASRPTFPAAVAALRASAARLPDELVVCLALAAVSDAALPLSLPALLNAAAAGAAGADAPLLHSSSHAPARDHTGSDAHAWARFTRAWAAEANRHGDALRTWLYLSGRADSAALSRSEQRLVGQGAALVAGQEAPGQRQQQQPQPQLQTQEPRGEEQQEEQQLQQRQRPQRPQEEEQQQQEQQQQRPRAGEGSYYAALMHAAYHARLGAVAAGNAARLAAYHTGEGDGEGEEEEGGAEGAGEGRGGASSYEAASASSATPAERAAACASAASCLPRLLQAIAADKARHEAAFSAAAREALRRDPSGALAALSSSIAGGGLLRSPAAALGRREEGPSARAGDEQGDGEGGGGGADDGGRLFLDASAAADALGVLTLRDRAAALDALCAAWGVGAAGEAAAAAALARGDAEGAREARARAAFACGHGARVKALWDLQTERRLRDRRRGSGRSASFAWVFGRECGLS